MKKVLYILSELSTRDIDWMLEVGKRLEIPAGSEVIKENQEIDALYIVLDGSLSVCVAALGEKEIATIGSGEVLGEMSFVDSRPPSATVTAIEKSLILAIPKAELNAKLQEDVLFSLRFYRAIAKFLSNRLRGTFSSLAPDEEKSESAEVIEENLTLAASRFDELLQILKDK